MNRNSVVFSSSTNLLNYQKKASPPASLDKKAVFYLVLLALQFGFQPGLTKKYTSPDVCRSTVVMVQEVLKFAMAWFMLVASGASKSAFNDWSPISWLSVAGVPATLYAAQNLAALQAYQYLDALTFNVLNQTKTLSAALCCYLVMGRTQSHTQIVALLFLLLSALVMEHIITLDTLSWVFLLRQNSDTTTTTTAYWNDFSGKHWTHGVVPVLLASFISGLAGALCQKNLQGTGGRNPYLFSMELCAASIMMLLLSLLVRPEEFQRIERDGFFHGWTPQTVIPILTNSAGGIIVGLVTKHAGSVRKGFALIFGILLSGLLQADHITTEQILGGGIAALSLWMHATNPTLFAKTTTTTTSIDKQD